MVKIDSCLMVGCGGIGSMLIEPMYRLLTYHPNGTDNVVVCERDKLEPKNLARQLLPENQVWRDKILALSRKLQIPSIIYLNEYVSYSNNYDIFGYLRVINGFPLIIGAVDNAATRHLLIKTCDDLYDNYIWLCPSNSYHIAQTSIHIKMNGEDITLHPFKRYKNLAEPDDQIPSKGCFEELESSPQLLAANHLATHFTLQYITCLLENKPVYSELIGDIFSSQFKSTGQLINYV
jgi:hypothetical protein